MLKDRVGMVGMDMPHLNKYYTISVRIMRYDDGKFGHKENLNITYICIYETQWTDIRNGRKTKKKSSCCDVIRLIVETPSI